MVYGDAEIMHTRLLQHGASQRQRVATDAPLSRSVLSAL